MGLRKQEYERLHSEIHQSSPPQVPTQGHPKKDALHRWNQLMYRVKI